MSRHCLRLSLRAGETLPAHLCWHIERGYVWLARWSSDGEPLTLGIWGPGEVVIPALIRLSHLELRTLSGVVVEEDEPSSAMERAFLEDQLHQAAILLSISRVRPAELRLRQLLFWFCKRFGTMTSQGVMLTFGKKNLTHQQLADIAGMTRVTVTKALSNFRRSGVIADQNCSALVMRVPALDLWECAE